MLPNISTIRLKRLEIGLSQRQLAEASGVTQGAIAKIESGKVDPSYSTVKRIFEVFEEEKMKEKTAKDLMSKKITFVTPNEAVEDAIKKMVARGFSQIPVIEGDRVVGRISEKLLVYLDKKDHQKKCGTVMASPLVTVGPDAKLSLLKEILKLEEAVVVVDKNRPVGIVTKNDLLR